MWILMDGTLWRSESFLLAVAGMAIFLLFMALFLYVEIYAWKVGEWVRSRRGSCHE
jgi:hypothetical protein